MPKSSKFGHNFNVLLDDLAYVKLTDLTQGGRVSRGHVIRQMIDATHRMQHGGYPTCASGSACMCPQLHPLPSHTRAAGDDSAA